MSKKSGEMLAEIKHGIETGEDKNGIKVDGIAYTWKQLEPLYQYIQTIQNEYKTLQKRNSRQRLANQKQYELILKLQQENERLKEENNNKAMNDYAHAIDESWYRELYDDYKSRCEKAYEELTYMSSSDYVKDYDIKQNCWTKLSNILQNGGDKVENI